MSPISYWSIRCSVQLCIFTVGLIYNQSTPKNASYIGKTILNAANKNRLYRLYFYNILMLLLFRRCLVCWAVHCSAWDRYWFGRLFGAQFHEMLHWAQPLELPPAMESHVSAMNIWSMSMQLPMARKRPLKRHKCFCTLIELNIFSSISSGWCKIHVSLCKFTFSLCACHLLSFRTYADNHICDENDFENITV